MCWAAAAAAAAAAAIAAAEVGVVGELDADDVPGAADTGVEVSICCCEDCCMAVGVLDPLLFCKLELFCS